MKIDGIEVVDATRPFELEITAKDTWKGRKDPWNCAAAVTALRSPDVIEARVYRSKAYLLFKLPSGKKRWVRYSTSPNLRVEIIAFDRGGKFEPDTYRLNAPTEAQQLDFKRDHGKRAPHKTKRPPPHVVKGIREHMSGYSKTAR